MKFLENIIENISNRIMKEFELFTHGVRVQMLIDRSVSNTNKGSKRWINKLVSTNSEEFKSNIIKLLELQYYLGNTDIRLYSCVNHRNLDKAIKYFKHKQLDIATEEEKIRFYSRINDKFCSALMKPENRGENLFLIDCDDENNELLNLNLCDLHKDGKFSGWHFRYGTPNGWHFITKPFDPKLLTAPHCEVKKDALMLLNVLEI